MAVYQTRSTSIRPSVPMMCAVLGPTPREEEIDVDSAPSGCLMMVATSVSVPVSPRRASAVTETGAPSMSQAKETG